MDLEHRIIEICKDYNIALGPNLLNQVLSDPHVKPNFHHWAKAHISHETILSRDEAETYDSLIRSGTVDTLLNGVDTSLVLPIGEQELKDAIDELNRSTEAIHQRAETLRLQQKALSALVERERQSHKAREERKALYRHSRERAGVQLASEIEEQCQIFDLIHTTAEEQRLERRMAFKELIQKTLQADDKRLAELQALGATLTIEDPSVQAEVDHLRQVCDKLVSYQVEGIRTKLNRVYLEHLGQTDQSSGLKAHLTVTATEITSIEDELESLYSEILPVAQMSVEQVFLGPAIAQLSCGRDQNLQRSSEVLDHTMAALDELVGRIDSLTDQLSHLNDYDYALASILATGKQEISTQLPISSPSKQNLQSPSKAPFSPFKMPTSPLKTRTNLVVDSPSFPFTPTAYLTRSTTNTRRHHSRRSSSGLSLSAASALTPLDQLLADLALSLPDRDSQTINRTQETREANVDYLATILRERTEKAQDVETGAQEAFERSVAIQLADSKRALQLARESVLADSEFVEVKLVDPGIEESIEVLGDEVENIERRLKQAQEYQKCGAGQRAEFVRRWA